MSGGRVRERPEGSLSGTPFPSRAQLRSGNRREASEALPHPLRHVRSPCARSELTQATPSDWPTSVTALCDNSGRPHPSNDPSLIMPELPSGTVTFLFTDIEGSTALWERDRAGLLPARLSAQLGVARRSNRGRVGNSLRELERTSLCPGGRKCRFGQARARRRHNTLGM